MRRLFAVMALLALSVGCGAKEDPKRGSYTDTSDPTKVNMGDLMKPPGPPAGSTAPSGG